MGRIRKKKIAEGDIVAVPATDNNGYFVSVVARTLEAHTLSGEVLLYFFGPRQMKVPDMVSIGPLDPKKAIDIVRTGVIRIHEGVWPVVGKLTEFDRSHWQIPIFGRVDLLDPSCGVIVRYIDDSLAGPRVEEKTSSAEAQQHIQDQLVGVDIASYDISKIH